MARLCFIAILIEIIVSISVVAEIKLNNVLFAWEEDYHIKELSESDIPEDCKKIGICSNITNYDTQFVTKLLTKLGSQKNFKKFNVDQLSVPNSFGLGEIEDLCASKEEVIWPQAAINEGGHWQYIVNTGALPFQGYRIHRCIESGSSCSKAAVFNELVSSCDQEKTLRNMVYIDVRKKQLATDYFQIPSCCSCNIRPTSPIYW